MVDVKASIGLLLFLVSCNAITIQHPPPQKLGHEYRMKTSPSIDSRIRYGPDHVESLEFNDIGLLNLQIENVVDEEPNSDDIWFLNPQIENAVQLVLSSAKLSSTPFREFANTMPGQTCVTVQQGDIGGLANTMGVINTALDVSLENGLKFRYPTIKPPDHHVGDAFANLFGHTSESCNVSLYVAECDPSLPKTENNTKRVYTGSKGSCLPSQYVVRSSPSQTNSHFCGCNQVIVLMSKGTYYHFDYSKTGDALRDAYWAANPKHFLLSDGSGLQIPGSTPISVTIHVRLGDVERGYWRKLTQKYQPPETYINKLKSLEALFPKGTMNVVIVTNICQHDDITTIISAARDHVTCLGAGAFDDFSAMVHSDILIVGGSGFSRFAAILQARTNPSFRIASQIHKQPLSYVAHTLETEDSHYGKLDTDTDTIPLIPEKDDAIVALRGRVMNTPN